MLVDILLFFLVFTIGRIIGKAEARMALSQAARDLPIYDKIIKLAELKGEDISKLTNDEIHKRVEKYKKDISARDDLPY